MTAVETTTIVALLAILATMSINAYNFSKESKYLKNKYKEKGYLEGYDQGFLDGVEFIESIIPPTPKKKKTLWDRGTK
jgi:hypothetical protein